MNSSAIRIGIVKHPGFYDFNGEIIPLGTLVIIKSFINRDCTQSRIRRMDNDEGIFNAATEDDINMLCKCVRNNGSRLIQLVLNI